MTSTQFVSLQAIEAHTIAAKENQESFSALARDVQAFPGKVETALSPGVLGTVWQWIVTFGEWIAKYVRSAHVGPRYSVDSSSPSSRLWNAIWQVRRWIELLSVMNRFNPNCDSPY